MALPHEGKVAIVTGSSRGIGKATALQFAREGADVVVCARTVSEGGAWPGTIGETAALVEKEGRRALALKMDVTSDEDIANVVETTMREFGRIDILVNNAGLTGNDAISASTEQAGFIGGNPSLLDDFYKVNVRGPYVLSQAVAAHMAGAGGGVIVNVSSGVARMPSPPTAEGPGRGGGGGFGFMGQLYGVSKAALDRMSGGLAQELWAKNIGVVTIYPGFTAVERAIVQGRDVSRAESPDVSAKAIAFVCREPLAHTGQIYRAKELVDQNGL